ncbi:hypothetical protein CTI12_AA378500 [Artemisia annua]|uniref:Replication protein A 70 kDa DNA-binding subunit B/D first OB fold domain-containing protein n=1 Tax=Artemisia annua TaxID=35608 RepID=A0A2U1MHW4_ARTAN|nr:hypothetical protein CTI12_AA378500 [Artemisia annua]
MALTGDADTSLKMMTLAIPQRSLAYFTELNPADNSKFIEARVYRKWTAMKIPSLIPTGFSCILLDKKGAAIQANADMQEKERFERDLQINCVYRIQGFGFEKTDNWGKTLDNDMTLCFGKHTQVDLVTDDDYPVHYFNFAAYNELGGRLEKKNPILTDYIGYVHNVEKTKEYGGATGNKIRLRNIGIRNLNNNVVVFTLWNEMADSFRDEEYAQMQQPVIIAVSSCYLKTYGGQIQLSATSATRYYFNPPIDETAQLLAAYNQNNPTIPPLQLQTERSADWEQERTRNRVALGTLLLIDPNTQQRVLFTQDVKILNVDTTQDWYYQKCDECGGKLRYGYVHGQCHPYRTQPNPQKSPQTDGLIKDINILLQEVANKDPQVTPPEILALQNTRHVLQFRFAKPAGKGPPTFVLQKVMDHRPAILTGPSEGPSSPHVTATETQATTEKTHHLTYRFGLRSYSFRIVVTDGTGNATITCFSPQTDGLIKDINILLEEVANKDPQVTPPQILALQNTRHVLQFRFAKPAGKGPPTFVLQKVMDHRPAILTGPSEGPSSPHVIATETQATTEISPPPATPTASQDTPANTTDATHPPSSSAVRKELFGQSPEQESEPETKKQKTD